MADWFTVEDRRIATDEFCKLLDKNDDERRKCRENMDYARAKFKEVGKFDNMPDNVHFCCLEEGQPQDVREPGDEIIFMSLYPKGQLPDPFEPAKVWRCTYQPYRPGGFMTE